YAEFGWSPSTADIKVPDANTVWTQVGSGSLRVDNPVTLTFDNGAGLLFRRTISVDDKYLFTAKDEVINKTDSPVTLYPFALISRHNTPVTAGFYILHEGPVGVLGDNGLLEKSYSDLQETKEFAFANTKGWLGF